MTTLILLQNDIPGQFEIPVLTRPLPYPATLREAIIITSLPLVTSYFSLGYTYSPQYPQTPPPEHWHTLLGHINNQPYETIAHIYAIKPTITLHRLNYHLPEEAVIALNYYNGALLPTDIARVECILTLEVPT